MTMKLISFSFLLFASLCFGPIHAAEKEQALTEESYKALTSAQELMEKNQHKEAISKLKQLLSTLNNKPYDKAVTLQTLGYAYYSIDDFKSAKDAFKRAIDSKALPKAVSHELEYSLAKLLVYLEDYKSALSYLNHWLESEPDAIAEAHIMAASIYHNLDQYKPMIPHLSKAISKSNNAPVNWYELLASAYIQTKQYKNAAKILERVVKRAPTKKEAWLQLAAVYQLSNQDKKALAISELAYKKDFLDGEQILALANNYLYLDMPYKAAMLLNKEIQSGRVKTSKDNLTLLANSWLLAQEPKKASQVYKTLLDAYEDNDARFQLGQIYYEMNDWQNTIDILNPYVANEQAKQKGEAYLFIGIAAYELNQKKESLKSFHRASAYKGSKEHALWWIEQIKDENGSLDG